MQHDARCDDNPSPCRLSSCYDESFKLRRRPPQPVVNHQPGLIMVNQFVDLDCEATPGWLSNQGPLAAAKPRPRQDLSGWFQERGSPNLTALVLVQNKLGLETVASSPVGWSTFSRLFRLRSAPFGAPSQPAWLGVLQNWWVDSVPM